MIRLEFITARRAVFQRAGSLLVLKMSSHSSVTTQNHLVLQKPYEEMPGPKPLPILGNTWRFLPYIGEFGNLDIDGTVNAIHKKYGKICKITNIYGNPDLVYLLDPADIETLYRNEGQWPVRPGINSALYYRHCTRKDLYKGVEGVFFTQGKEWYEFRTRVNQTMLQPKNSKKYVRHIDEVANDLIQRMRILRNPDGELPYNFFEYIRGYSLEAVSVIALDTRLGCLDKDVKPESETRMIMDAMDVVTEALYELDIKKSPIHFTKRKHWKYLVDGFDTIHEISMKYVTRSMERIKNKVLKDEKEMSVLETLLIKNEDPMIATVMALDMMLAGLDPVSISIATALHFLARNQDKQEQLSKELYSILPLKDQPLTAKNLEDMKYLKACINESSRLSPVMSVNARLSQKEFTIRNYIIPKGVMILTCLKFIGLSEENFPQPYKYIPERWLKDEQEQKMHPFVFIPFGYGARACLGRRFGELEIKTLVSRIIRNFRIEYDQELEITSSVVNRVSSPLNFKLEERP